MAKRPVMWDQLWIDANLATMTDSADAYGSIVDGAIGLSRGSIAWIGPASDLPGPPTELARDVRAARGLWITPGLIDCHTHLIFGGTRVGDFELRLAGASRADIAEAGGGVISTIRATQGASHAMLSAAAGRRLRALLAEGVTTVEVKSGYGIDVENELKLLRVARELETHHPVSVVSTLGVYVMPEDFSGGRDAYVEYLCTSLIPAALRDGQVSAVDVQVDELGFSKEEAARIFQAARQAGLMLRAHTDELSDFGGASFMADLRAATADHLEFASEDGVAAMAEAGIVAVLLPGNTHVLQRRQIPPVRLLRQYNVPMAVATNCNPGPSPATSLSLMMNMACVLYGLTPAEALAGVTRHAAAALGLGTTHGTLEVGKAADLAVWQIEHPAELSYYLGFNPIAQVVKAGKLVLDRTEHGRNNAR